MMNALWTVLTVFRTATGLDTQECADLYLIAGVISPVYRLCLEQQIVERQIEQGFDFFFAPIVARRGICQTRILLLSGTYQRTELVIR